MTTPQLAAAVGSEETVARVFEAVAAVLFAQGRAEVSGFGVFTLHQQPARRARNPRTGEAIAVPAKVVVKFKPANALKHRAEQLPNVPGA